MKVIKSEEDMLEFDNGLRVEGWHSQDCCEHNYLDFEQLPVGTKIKDLTLSQFLDEVSIKDDGFAIKDIKGVPKWVQARSVQNGYYSSGVGLKLSQGDKNITVGEGEIFSGKEEE